ncbi:MAG: glycosyltransferase [Clostridiales bacterium]|nr:glycosyltransferase [Clostridiales bacterium]
MTIEQLPEYLKVFNIVIMIVFSVFYFYQYAYMPLYWILVSKQRKQPKKEVRSTTNDYAVLICARNEERVIPDLIRSIKTQTYDSGSVSIFVMADNCTDGTAFVSRELGANVYERHNTSLVGKGYALDMLLKNIWRDHGDVFDGYFVFDADNILTPDFIKNMDHTIAEGHDIVMCYRNSKNYGDSWISAGNGLWYMRENRYMNHTRSLLGLSCTVTGTGFFFSKKVADELGGWPYHTLVEDTEFSSDQIIRGRKIAYCPEAEVFDEQTSTLCQSWRQRLRWSRGYLQVLKRYGWKLIKGMFRGNFSCYDMAMSILPAFLLTTVSVGVNLVAAIVIIVMGGDLLKQILSILQVLFGAVQAVFVIGLVSCVTEWKKIRATKGRKIASIFTLPLFMMTYIPIAIESLFVNPRWKPIDHSVSLASIEERPEAERILE